MFSYKKRINIHIILKFSFCKKIETVRQLVNTHTFFWLIFIFTACSAFFVEIFFVLRFI